VHVFRGLPPAADSSIALTIGNFDGVHRGHQAMLARLVEAADDLALPSAVLTFDPPPREFFAKASAPPRLSSIRDKVEQFAARGVARVYVARFDARLASLEPEAFIDAVLVRRLGARCRKVSGSQGAQRGSGATPDPARIPVRTHAGGSAQLRCLAFSAGQRRITTWGVLAPTATGLTRITSKLVAVASVAISRQTGLF